MRTVTGKVLSTTPTSLSKAASILTNFISTETGASHAVSAYLRRASASFSELTQLHKELKPSSKSDRKHNKKPKSEAKNEIPTRSFESSQQQQQQPSGLSEEKVKVSHEVKHKRKKKSGEVKVEVKIEEEEGQNGNFDRKVKIEEEEEVSERKREKKKKKKSKKDRGDVGNFEEKRGKIGIKEEKVEEEEEEEGKENNSEERRRKKKKRKSEGDS